MFLQSLKNEQKILFLQLAIKAAEANGIVDLAEKNMLKAYAMEMEITPFYTASCDLDEILHNLKKSSTERDLRIILFEILGVLFSDGEFDSVEHHFAQKVYSTLDISQKKYNEMLELLNDYAKIYTKIVDTVL